MDGQPGQGLSARSLLWSRQFLIGHSCCSGGSSVVMGRCQARVFGRYIVSKEHALVRGRAACSQAYEVHSFLAICKTTFSLPEKHTNNVPFCFLGSSSACCHPTIPVQNCPCHKCQPPLGRACHISTTAAARLVRAEICVWIV